MIRLLVLLAGLVAIGTGAYCITVGLTGGWPLSNAQIISQQER